MKTARESDAYGSFMFYAGVLACMNAEHGHLSIADIMLAAVAWIATTGAMWGTRAVARALAQRWSVRWPIVRRDSEWVAKTLGGAK